MWIALHGQGMLARYFILKLKPLVQVNTCVIAPEGLHRYYLDGKSGRSGASWMTSDARATDIRNYINWLNQVSEEVLSRIGSQPSIHILGFSQGTATATRWACETQLSIKTIVLWGGLPAFDLDTEKAILTFHSIQFYDVQGKIDPFMTKKKQNEKSSLYQKLHIKPRSILFDGKHEITEKEVCRIRDDYLSE